MSDSGEVLVEGKVYISADKERTDCWKMAAEICKHEEPVDLVIGLTRGGGPIGFYLQEFFCAYWKKKVGYANLRTRSYEDVRKAGGVQIGSLEEVKQELKDGRRIVVADDIFDRGRTIETVLAELHKQIPGATVTVATLYYKPENCEVDLKPDYYVEQFPGKQWVVFPRSVTEADGAAGLRALGVPEDILPMFNR